MGLTIFVRVGNPLYPSRSQTIECLVDSGAIYSVVPGTLLRRLGIKPLGTEPFRLADGRRVRRQLGEATFSLDRRTRTSPVIFGRPRDQPLLGIVTLESLGLGLDPVSRKLKPIPLILA
jgi:predicted aspartyl protease